MNIHENARLTPLGRKRLAMAVLSGQTPEAAARAAGVCPRTARKWVKRFQPEGRAGHSRHEAAAHFDTSVSFAVNLMKLWHETGSVDPRPRGGFRHGKLEPHRDFILETVTARGDPAMPELAEELKAAKGVEVTASALSKFLISCGFSSRKPSGQENKTALNWRRPAWNGRMPGSPSCANSATG